MPPSPSALNVPQQTILDCVRNLDQALPRSTVAKLLAGSRSTRVELYAEWEFFGRLSALPRKSILHYIDTLLQQGYLTTDIREGLILPPATPDQPSVRDK